MFQSWLVDVSACIFQLHSIRSCIRTWFIWLRWIEVFCVSIETSLGMSNLNVLRVLNRIVFRFQEKHPQRNDTRLSKLFLTSSHFSTTTPNWKMQITRVTHCHAGYQASFFKAPKNFTFAGTRRAAWQTKSISGFSALCCVFSVFSAAREK